MSASRLFGVVVFSSWLGFGCGGSSKKIEVGGACMLNSDCNGALVCTMGRCHEACRVSADCPAGQSCVKAGNMMVCQLPVEAHCVYSSDCQIPLVCAADLRCRNQCRAHVDCSPGQVCTTTQTCAEPNQVDSNNSLLLPVRAIGA